MLVVEVEVEGEEMVDEVVVVGVVVVSGYDGEDSGGVGFVGWGGVGLVVVEMGV